MEDLRHLYQAVNRSLSVWQVLAECIIEDVLTLAYGAPCHARAGGSPAFFPGLQAPSGYTSIIPFMT
jgi:hypothetical protein